MRAPFLRARSAKKPATEMPANATTIPTPSSEQPPSHSRRPNPTAAMTATNPEVKPAPLHMSPIACFVRPGGATRQMFFTSSWLKLSPLPLRAITNSASDRLTNLPETFFLPVFLSTSIFSPACNWRRRSQDWFGTVEDWFGVVACCAIAPGAVKIESQNRQEAVIFIQALLT